MQTGFVSDRELLKRRSEKYMSLIASLDHGTLTETKGMEELKQAIIEEFGTADIAGILLGIVSKCFLGPPYEVHTLDLSRTQIIHHYKVGEPMSLEFEKARTAAKHNAYAFVEVYTDRVILVKEDGSTTKL